MKNFQVKTQFLLILLFLCFSTLLSAQSPPKFVHFKGVKSTAAYPADVGKYTLSETVKDGRGCGCYNHESGNYSMRRVEALGIKWYIFEGTCENPKEAVTIQNGDLLSGVVAYDGEGCDPVKGVPNLVSYASLSFSGAQQFIEVSGTKLAQGNSDRTVYAWIKTTQKSIGNIVSWGTNKEKQRNGFAVRDGKPAFIGAFADYTGTTVINDGKWHHIAMVYNGKQMTMYVDGRPAGTGPFNYYNKPKKPLMTTGQNLRLGNISTPENMEFFQGEMKAVKIWNEALPASAFTSTGISTTKRAAFSYYASQPIPSNFKLYKMSEASNWK